MPRVTPAHEQAVRQRIVEAATAVFGELGFRRATVQDVVRQSGLSVGAVYNHFKSKEALFLAACIGEAEHEKAELKSVMDGGHSAAERLQAATEWAVNTATGVDTSGVLLRAWSDAGESPDLQQMLAQRRSDMTAFSTAILADAVAAGELPAWIDTDGLAAAFVTLLDGLTLRANLDADLSREEAYREVRALLDLLLFAPKERPAAQVR